MRVNAILAADIQIIGLAETHLKLNRTISIKGFTWYGLNRDVSHKQAKRSSGGIGFLVRDDITAEYEVSTLDATYEGILWIQLHSKAGNRINACVCYLPPENSTRHVNSDEYFNKLLTQLYMYIDCELVYICGDFNARCGNDTDYIEGVDCIKERHVIDYKINSHGKNLLDFCINSNMCILNGRNTINNDFTSISTKGLSVVDYALVPYCKLDCFQNFYVANSSELIHETQSKGIIDPDHSIPDHSLLKWTFEVTKYIRGAGTQPGCYLEKHIMMERYDFQSIPNDFMNTHETLTCVNVLGNTLYDSQDIDYVYSQFRECIHGEMKSKIPYKSVILNDFKNSTKHRSRKPWWNDDLSILWNEQLIAEKEWCKSTDTRRASEKSKYLDKRKRFDKAIQQTKRKWWLFQQNELLNLRTNNCKQFWKRIGNIGIAYEKKDNIPWEVVTVNGSVSDKEVVLDTWAKAFSSLLNNEEVNSDDNLIVNEKCDNNAQETIEVYNMDITTQEIEHVLLQANKGKAQGTDNIPIEVLQNEHCKLFMYKLFHTCFITSKIPAMWKQGIINPIPKCTTSDPRDPYNYRGITITCAMYKLYCSILNERLTKWADSLNVLEDEQNGFRKNRSCLDHLYTLTNIIESRKLRRQNTFVAYVDFSKAYDRLHRDLLWYKLRKMGLHGNLLDALKSLYSGVSGSVRLNGHMSEWFNINTGLKQGCVISPLLFNLYVNDIAQNIKSLDKGININNTQVSILQYADDIALIAANEIDLQCMLNCLGTWCTKYKMAVNMTKTQIVHYRTPSIQQTSFTFKIHNSVLEVSNTYKYLGLYLNEFLDFNQTAKQVAKSAGRALGLLIAKSKAYGGMPYEVYTQLYDSMVDSIISYGSAIWGNREYTCISAIQNKACRFFLGLGNMRQMQVFKERWAGGYLHIDSG